MKAEKMKRKQDRKHVGEKNRNIRKRAREWKSEKKRGETKFKKRKGVKVRGKEEGI